MKWVYRFLIFLYLPLGSHSRKLALSSFFQQCLSWGFWHQRRPIISDISSIHHNGGCLYSVSFFLLSTARFQAGIYHPSLSPHQLFDGFPRSFFFSLLLHHWSFQCSCHYSNFTFFCLMKIFPFHMLQQKAHTYTSKTFRFWFIQIFFP